MMSFVELPERIERNIIVSAPTGSGKTTAFLRHLSDYLNQFEKVYMLFPTKALINQITTVLDKLNINYLRDDSDARLDYDISLKDWFDHNLIVTSYEKADSSFLLRPELATNSLIMIDEIHLATTERALSILSILANCKNIAKFIVMSATIPNLHELADYLNANIIKFEKQKNIKIIEHYLGHRPERARTYYDFTNCKIIDIIRKDPHKPTIVFVMSRRRCESLAEIITNLTPARAVPFHSGINKDDRNKIINQFMNKKINVLVATNALAYGINTPTERVIIGGLSVYTFEGWKTLKSVDIVQMMGRAGRPGYTDNAEVHLIYFEEEEEILRSALTQNYAEEIGIKSDLDTIILRLIMTKRLKSIDNINKIAKEWFNVPPPDEWFNAIIALISDGLIDRNLKLTRLGRLVAKHYLTIRAYRHIKSLVFNNPMSRERKLDSLAYSIYQISPGNYQIPELPPEDLDFLSIITFTKESQKVLAQLLTPTGDTDRIAESVKKLSYFLHEATNDPDWLLLAKAMIVLRKLSKSKNASISRILKAYINGTIENIIKYYNKRKLYKLKKRS